MKRRLYLLLTILISTGLYAQDGNRLPSLAETLIQLNERQEEWHIHFIYDELERYQIAVPLDSVLECAVPMAVRHLVGVNPVRIMEAGNNLFVESLLKDRFANDTVPPEMVGYPLMPLLTVTAARPLVSVQNGRFVYDPVALADGYVVSNSFDLVSLLPGIVFSDNRAMQTVDGTPVTILVDGRRHTLDREGINDYLLSLPAERVSRIEVITHPSPELHADGAAVNLVLQGDRQSNRSGLLQAEAIHQSRFGARTRGAMQMTSAHWSQQYMLALHADRARSGSDFNALQPTEVFSMPVTEKTRADLNNNILRFNADITRRWSNGRSLTLSETFNFDYLKTNVLTVNTHFNESPSKDRGNLLQNELQLTFATPHVAIGTELQLLEDWRKLNIAFHGYRVYDNDSLFTFQRLQYVARSRTFIDGTTSHFTARSFTYRFLAGASYTFTRIDNRPQLVKLTVHEKFNDGDQLPNITGRILAVRNLLHEHTLNAYIGTEGNNKRVGLNYSASLRYEHDILDGQHLSSLLPCFSATWRPRPSHALTAAYDSQRSYPSYWSRQNYLTYISLYTLRQGNPDLQAPLRHNATLTYTWKSRYQLQFMAQRTSQPILCQDFLSVNYLRKQQEKNIDHSTRFYLIAHAPFVWRRFALNFTAYGWYQRDVASQWYGHAYDRHAWSGAALATASLRVIDRSHRLNLSTTAHYRSRSIEGAYTLSPTLNLNAGLTWQLPRRRATVSFEAKDLLERAVPDVRERLAEQHFDITNGLYARTFTLTVSYRLR